jgi:aldose 1-epimerase
MGFPGNLEILQTFRLLEGGVLDITMRATTDAPTLCNLAHHSYFNLGMEETVDGHTLRVDAATYLPVDPELIPTGEPAPVAGTRFDFRTASPLGPASAKGLIDHNFCLSDDRVAIHPVAELCCPETGVAMEVRTTEPGLQVYCGAALDVPVPGLDGRRMGPRSGIALEPQVWPDAPHHPAFPQAVLRPGETYRQNTQFIFRKESR